MAGDAGGWGGEGCGGRVGGGQAVKVGSRGGRGWGGRHVH